MNIDVKVLVVALTLAIAQTCTLDAMKYINPTNFAHAGLQKAGKSILNKDLHGQTVLHHAACLGEVDATKVALILAQNLGEGKFFELLCMKDKNGRTALYYAADNGYALLAKIICNRAESVNTKKASELMLQKYGYHGDTLFHVAAAKNTIEILKIFLDTAAKGIGIKKAWCLLFQFNKDGKTAWDFLSQNNKDSLCQYYRSKLN